ncbi:MAG: HU family DNA-binding protein [Rubinisphaera brasiliensis]|uniref:Histone family protein DNA-binding protein n=1 Tax=Rubinisphaera brasiliensis (strain ATCC 49424 / DSM 5305 / JCM 21570 / IAM 15109 / NBRC 103401 / IFAM 1448) TaxID=756272 RepID=F0SKP6_RUBBR|nr:MULTISPECIES: HU family DNA-binding protein [Rubinisphaera]ADY58716.1 histone family protein DNA-binding protein [Rubinisphaera brasiliensis DSM 5305]
MALFAEQQRVHYSKAILEDRMAAKQAKPMSKTELLTSLSESTGLSKKDVSAVLDGLGEVIQKNLGKRGPGVFNLPGLLKIQVQRKPATKATTRENPFKPGEMMTVKAKPARNVVKVRPLKGLKDMV